MGEIRIDCYLAKLKKYKRKYPNAHFEYVNNRNILAPSEELLHKHLPTINAYRRGEITKKEVEKDFLLYSNEYLDEINNNPKAIKRLKELAFIKQYQDIFLICYCRDETLCHRIIIKKILDRKGEINELDKN
jgi:uncharacterized protein YeaO (DUF488 family)